MDLRQFGPDGIGVDGDGLVFDYNQAYALAWERAFGWRPTLVRPQAYWAIDRWGVPRLSGTELAHFRAQFDAEFWSTLPAIDGAVEACTQLRAALGGRPLVMVTALAPQYAECRRYNLRALGIELDAVIATSDTFTDTGASPKAAVVEQLQLAAFVEDYAVYLRGMPRHRTHLALVLREQEGSPNTGDDLSLAHSTHPNLKGFATWWLAAGRDQLRTGAQ